MSASYKVSGYIEVRIQLTNLDFNCSQSTTSEELAELVKEHVKNCTNHGCEVINHKLQMERIN